MSLLGRGERPREQTHVVGDLLEADQRNGLCPTVSQLRPKRPDRVYLDQIGFDGRQTGVASFFSAMVAIRWVDAAGVQIQGQVRLGGEVECEDGLCRNAGQLPVAGVSQEYGLKASFRDDLQVSC